MEQLGTRTLETPRLLLRRFTPADAGDMYRNWANDPAVTHYLTWAPHSSEAVSLAHIEAVAAGYDNPAQYDWGIALKALGQVIGSITVVSQAERVDSVHIGYCIGRAWWNQGITTEAFRAVIRFLMEEVGVNRIESRHDPRNPNSGKVMLACGLTYEGTLRQSDRSNQGLCDAAWYGLLRSEYLQREATP